jgi:lipopolysaccharide heptosyltransferase II
MSDWSSVKNILCIRPDNMGDLVMSGPALRHLKQGLNARITVLTSSMASGVVPFMSEIDELITFDLPWVKNDNSNGPDDLPAMIDALRQRKFDAAVIFTVYSQNPLPSAMIAYQAGIPKVLAYCRENPYGLISDWVVDEEPYAFISHQVDRDLRLVSKVCPITSDVKLKLTADETLWPGIAEQLTAVGLDLSRPWLILHPGVSEIKRQLANELWVASAKKLVASGFQILLTGTTTEKQLTDNLQSQIGEWALNTAGLFNIGQMITLIKKARLLLSVNTGTVHLAAAVGTPVVVLYAQTNPQHTPWMVPHVVIEFPVAEELKSKNDIIRQVDQTLYAQPAQMPDPDVIVKAVLGLINPLAESDPPSHEIPNENQATAAN